MGNITSHLSLTCPTLNTWGTFISELAVIIIWERLTSPVVKFAQAETDIHNYYEPSINIITQ